MPRVAAVRVCALLLAGVAIALVAAPRAADVPAPLAIGAEAPDFTLPGVDGKSYSLASFAKSPVLVVMFTAVHCPTAEVYEARMKQLVADYQPKGVAFAVIQPNSAKALRLDEMGYTDLGDSLDDMKVRAEHRQVQLPVPLRRRDAGDLTEVRPGGHAARLRVRQAAAPALSGPHRQQPARGVREGARRAQRHRRRALGRHGRRREDADGRAAR